MPCLYSVGSTAQEGLCLVLEASAMLAWLMHQAQSLWILCTFQVQLHTCIYVYPSRKER